MSRSNKNPVLGTAKYQGRSLKSTWVITSSQKTAPDFRQFCSFCAHSLSGTTGQNFELLSSNEKLARFLHFLLQTSCRCSCCRVGRALAFHTESINICFSTVFLCILFCFVGLLFFGGGLVYFLFHFGFGYQIFFCFLIFVKYVTEKM